MNDVLDAMIILAEPTVQVVTTNKISQYAVAVIITPSRWPERPRNGAYIIPGLRQFYHSTRDFNQLGDFCGYFFRPSFARGGWAGLFEKPQRAVFPDEPCFLTAT